MTRNQKIALGCGGAGCLGLIVVTVAGCLIYFLAYRASERRDRYANINFNSNRTSNLNRNRNDNADDSTDSTDDSSASTGSLTEDDKHKLFQAAAITGDYELQRRVWVKIGILEDDFTQGDKFTDFGLEHGAWILRNYQWVGSMDTPDKGRAYVNEHLD